MNPSPPDSDEAHDLTYASTVIEPALRRAMAIMLVWGIIDAVLACPMLMLGTLYWRESLQLPGYDSDVEQILGSIAIGLALALLWCSLSCFILRRGMIAGKAKAFRRAIGMTNIALAAVLIVLALIVLGSVAAGFREQTFEFLWFLIPFIVVTGGIAWSLHFTASCIRAAEKLLQVTEGVSRSD